MVPTADSGRDAASPSDPDVLFRRVAGLVDDTRARQQGTRAHDRALLVGPDPDDPARVRSEPVSWWFGRPTAALVRALGDPASGWVVPGSPASSRILTELLASGNAMARALSEAQPSIGGRTGVQVLGDWIDAGCPVPEGGASSRPSESN